MTSTVPLKRVTRMAYGSSLASDMRIDGEFPVVGSGGISGTHTARNFRAPGIVVGRKGSYGSIHWLPTGGFAIDTAYYIDERLTSADLRWLYYVLQAVDLKGPSQDVGVPGLAREAAYEVPVPTPPPLEEQRRTAGFLDAETSRIDRLMAKMCSQDELLSSRRRAVLAATWHPEVRVARLGYFLNLVTSGPRGWGEYIGSEGNMFFRSANLWRDSTEPKLASVAYVDPPPSALAESIRSTIRSGDVLVGITGANTGWVCLANQDVVGANVSQHVCLLRPSRLVSGKWLAYLLSSPLIQDSLLGSQYGGTKTQLSLPDLRDLKVPIPDLRTQQSVADEIQHQIIAIENERGARARQLALLAERRQALITAAVTGQLDVTTARPAPDRDL
ncbi:restriction endonuclease subunit S [Streptomyces purpureus]|uniref:Type I restriction modification DNA specificity domain-containing protein n=1 Tax=Streptomyces purpureus TaxID=1951 RepID=A0A918GZP7_9ACTN|nr:restriction endonuclease subunit S [Streptomyces purpureus]GGT26078.1 hypothetical protein GCM10014713_18930 [Streptomyces purpureus]